MSHDILDQILNDLNDADTASPRSQQSLSGILGPSDIGFCRQKAVLVTIGTEPSDKVSKYAAMWGTAIHNYVEAALKAKHPDWILGSIDQLHVTATLKSGVEIGGHPDIVIPELNMLLDIKTVDGFEWVNRNGVSDAHQYQRWLYALGCVQAGILKREGLLVGNLYFDRSGKESGVLHLAEFTMDLEDEVERWVSDVTYAVTNGEDAARDVAPSVCAKICEFYTVCRGNLPVHDGQEFTEDRTLIDAIDLYVEGKNLSAEGERMKKAAKSVLGGFNGTDGRYQVRWVEIQPAFVEGYQRAGSMRLDVVPLKRG